MKRMITQRTNINYLSGTLEQFIDGLREDFENEVPEEYRATAFLELTQRMESYSDREYGTIEIRWDRPETDIEKEARLKKEQEWAATRRATYEQLKKEFGE